MQLPIKGIILTCILNKRLWRCAAMMTLLFIAGFAKAQSPVYSYVPADSGFVMEISRLKSEVIISLTFSDSLAFDYIAIERQSDFTRDFSQCKYIAYDEVKMHGRHLVKHDIYAFPGSSNVLYRLKLATKDGALRTYAPISLPPVSK